MMGCQEVKDLVLNTVKHFPTDSTSAIVCGTMTMITLNNLNADLNCWKECVQYDENDCSIRLMLIS